MEKRVSIAHRCAHLERAAGRKLSKFNVYITHDSFADISDVNMETEEELKERNKNNPARNLTLKLTGNSPRAFSETSDQLDDDVEPVISAEEIELEHNVWDFAESTFIFDAILFNTNEDVLV